MNDENPGLAMPVDRMLSSPVEASTFSSHREIAMAAGQAQAHIKAMEEILQQKEEILGKEREAIQGLNSVLNKMGYQIVSMSQVPKRRGRPPGSGKKNRVKAGAKRRGRPPKTKTEAS